MFAGQFLAEGVRRGEPAVFVTLEEPVRDLRANLMTLGHDVPAWEEAGDCRFVDASPLVRLGEDGSPSSRTTCRPWPRRSGTRSMRPARSVSSWTA